MKNCVTWTDDTVDGILSREHRDVALFPLRKPPKDRGDALTVDRAQFSSDIMYHKFRLSLLRWQRAFGVLRIDADWRSQLIERLGKVQDIGLTIERDGSIRPTIGNVGDPEVLDLIIGRGIFVPRAVAHALDGIVVQYGDFATEGTSVQSAQRGYLLRNSRSAVFLPGLDIASEDFRFKRIDVSHFPAILARWLESGLRVKKEPNKSGIYINEHFGKLIDIIGDAQRSVDQIETFYSKAVADQWIRVGNIGVLDMTRPAFYAIPGIADMPWRQAQIALRAAVLKRLRKRREFGVRGAAITREDVARTIIGIIAMYEPKSRGYITVHIPHENGEAPYLGYEYGMRRQPIAERTILRFLEAANVRGVSWTGNKARMIFDLREGLALTQVERAMCIGFASVKLRQFGIDPAQLKSAA